MSNSMLYTIGTALNHARDNGLEVSLLVEGQWISGLVAAVDGFGVLLATDGDHAVVRVEAVSAVRIAGGVPHRTEIPAAAHPMPAPPRAAGSRH